MDKSLFETIKMETLYENKQYIQLVKSYEKRIEKLEKDHQKVWTTRINEETFKKLFDYQIVIKINFKLAVN